MKNPRRALRHDVRDGIVRSILEGEFGAGDRLIEMQIAKEYGTSQGPVREALRELEMLGFVRSEPHRGTYVRDPWQRGMLELYDVRAALEEFAARMATPRLRDDVSALQAEVDGMADAAVRNDVHAAVEHSERFHRLIVEASDNKLLHTMWSSLSITDHTALTMVTLSLDMTTLAESHQPIVDAIAAGDVELACRVSREHQAWFVDMLNAMARRHPPQQPEAEDDAELAAQGAPEPLPSV
jgi:DNA-binding GntR family transcriptional regulator